MKLGMQVGLGPGHYVLSLIHISEPTRQAEQTAHRSDSIGRTVWATVYKTVRPMLSDLCLSVMLVLTVCHVLSVTLVYCGLTVG